MNVDTETAMTVLGIALDQAAAIRRDYPWTKSEDSPRRHAFVLRDVEKHLIPRCNARDSIIVQGAINGEREAFAGVLQVPGQSLRKAWGSL